ISIAFILSSVLRLRIEEPPLYVFSFIIIQGLYLAVRFSGCCSLEGAGSAALFRRDWRSFDLGFCFAFDLIGFRLFRGFRRGLRSARKPRAKRSNTPSVSRKNHAAATSLGEGGLKI
ncbi:hypothetical protein, partial [Cloacibacillus evryensis]|uniref:hypothetical protein n=1 Tax=Cloacibacillus evryensis TaxID=508460 RepID=UPI00210B5460